MPPEICIFQKFISCQSQAVEAVVLTVTLQAIDTYKSEKLAFALGVETVPFFVLIKDGKIITREPTLSNVGKYL